MSNEKPLTTGEVADLTHVHLRTVLQWIHDGKLKAYRTPGNHSRIQVLDFIDFLKTYNMPIPEFLSLRGSTRKILIVDDDANMVSSLKRLFKKDSSFEVDVAYDGFEAGIKLLLFKPDIVILDMRMPGMNGYEVAQKVKRSPNCVHTAIIGVSAYFEEADKRRLLEIGVEACVDKPFNSEALLAQVHSLMNVVKAKG
ncbi:MAG: response regulator [Candidatus Omnitrophica bacterium]|nr:response regulator [Candidatus Omnitrophota bacterium]